MTNITSRTLDKKCQSIYSRYLESIEKDFSRYHNASDYASKLDISLKKLNAACRKYKGESAKQVLDKRIVSEIKNLLSYTSLTVSEISDRLGFREPTNLAKFFRRHTELTPTEFRRLMKSIKSMKQR